MSSSQKLRSNPSLLVLSHSPQPTNLRTDPSSRLLYCMHHSDLSTSLFPLPLTQFKHHIFLTGLLQRLQTDLQVLTNLWNFWLLLQSQMIASVTSEWQFDPIILLWRGPDTCLIFRADKSFQELSPAMAQVSKPNPSGSRTCHHLLPQGFCTGSFFILCFLHPPSSQLPL